MSPNRESAQSGWQKTLTIHPAAGNIPHRGYIDTPGTTSAEEKH